MTLNEVTTKDDRSPALAACPGSLRRAIDNDAGNTAIWFMNGLQISSTASLGNIPTIWTVQGMNAD